MTLDPKAMAAARRLWKEHGGRQHGPHVETLTMPEEKFDGFIQAAITAYLSAPPVAEPVAWICTGCSRLTTDPAADLAELKKRGHLSCCPERNMEPLIRSAPATARNEALEEAAKWVEERLATYLDERAVYAHDSDTGKTVVHPCEPTLVSEEMEEIVDGIRALKSAASRERK